MQADGVFSGGGVKGLAFAGALQAAADAGYDEWVRVAGTSAGAITAMALAVGYDAQGLRARLDKLDFSTLADYGHPRAVEEPLNLARLRGATRGVALHEWITALLSDAPRPARVFGDLAPGKLTVVGADLAHSRMVVFPDDVSFYVDDHGRPFDPQAFPIADAVRISAGFPYFFPPLTLRDGQTGKPGVLVDGGVVSPYPVFLFDSTEPTHPTWGFKLFAGHAPDKPSYSAIDGALWPVEMLKAIVDTSMNALDRLEEKSFGPRTVTIPTGDVPTLEFGLSESQKRELYTSGYEAARAFFAARPDGRNLLGAVAPGVGAEAHDSGARGSGAG